VNDALGEAGLWESRYQSGEDLFGAKPNAFFLEALQARPPGRLLLPGEGEGRNALAALRLGWEVCAFDLSPTARDRALGKTLSYELGALPALPEAGSFSEPFDLIAVIFVHLPAAVRRAAHQALAARLAPGGTLLIQSFAPKQAANPSMGPNSTARLASPGTLARDCRGLEVLRAQEREMVLDEGPLHTGPASVVEFLAQRPR
jgi:SAM-dependent methyltransferase